MSANDHPSDAGKCVNCACPQCRTQFVCQIAAGQKNCWCMSLPAVLPVYAAAQCLCPDCLTQRVLSLNAEVSESCRDESA